MVPHKSFEICPGLNVVGENFASQLIYFDRSFEFLVKLRSKGFKNA